MSLKVIGITTLEDLPAGSLFFFDTTLGFKSEYHTESGAIEAFCVGSGEYLTGGAKTPQDRGNLKVIQVELDLTIKPE